MSYCVTVLSRHDGVHLGWRNGPVWDEKVSGGSHWTGEHVQALGAWLWEHDPQGHDPHLFREQLGDEISSLMHEPSVVETICMKTGIRLMYRTLGPDSWDLVVT